MSRSFVGKALVIIHAAMSIGVLAWAIGVAAHRIHWNNPPTPSGGTQQEGIYAKQQAKATEYSDAAKRAYSRWSGNLGQVQQLELERYPRRAFYAQKLEMVKTGLFNKQPVQNPVQQLVYAPNGYIDISKPAGGPPVEVRAGVAAVAQDSYVQALTKLIQDTEASQVRNAQAIVDREKLNKEIVGVKDPPTKGLRQLINEQKNIEDQAKAEDVYVNDAVTNREAEFGLLKKRRDALAARKIELGKGQ
jgi:hypothetical protein